MAEWDIDYEYLETLVVRAQEGDSDAFAELYLATYKKVYRFAYRYLGNARDAEDAVQETYIIVLRKINTLMDSLLFMSWLNQITFRVCFAIKKKRSEEDNSDAAQEMLVRKKNASYQPEDIAIQVDERKFIISKVMGLPFSESQAIILHYYDKLKIEEIARLMEISRSSVKRYLASGKKKLSMMVDR